MKYRLAPRADREAERIARWWRDHRPAAPDLFLTELDQTLALVTTAPALGEIFGSIDQLAVHRVLLERTRFYAYYVVEQDVVVIAIWSALRGRPPRLRRR